jgi:hypothetical protein
MRHKPGKATASHSSHDSVGGHGRRGRRITVQWPHILVFARPGAQRREGQAQARHFNFISRARHGKNFLSCLRQFVEIVLFC